MSGPSIGRLSEFNPGEEAIEAYLLRLKHFFLANSVKEANKVSVLMTVIGPKVLATLSDLLSPTAIASKTYDELVDVLKEHYAPKRLVVAERYVFYSRGQKPGESISEFGVAIKHLASTCEFGGFLSDALRDKLISGITNENIRPKLLSEEKEFNETYSLAIRMEQAEKQSNLFGSPHGEIAKFNMRGRGEPSSGFSANSKNRPSVNSNQSRPGSVYCFRCGAKEHKVPSCPYSAYKCHGCKQQGHLLKMCSKRKNSAKGGAKSNFKVNQVEEMPRNQEENDQEVEQTMQDLCLYKVGSTESGFEVSLVLNDVPVVMEVDTGCAVSICPADVFEKRFVNIELKPVSIKLSTYSGHNVQVLGQADVHVTYNEQTFKLPLVLARLEKPNQPMLFGRNWLHLVKLDWHKIFTGRPRVNSYPSPKGENMNYVEPVKVGLISDRPSVRDVEMLKNKYKSVFQPGTGEIKGVEAQIVLKPGSVPKFCKARPVPFALRDKVEEELDRWIRDGIAYKVTDSQWSTPLVVVPKPKGVRICADYRISLNPWAEAEHYPLPSAEDIFASLAGCAVFSCIDLSNAYQQLVVAEESQHLLTLSTHRGLIRLKRLPFGLSSSPAIFQAAIDKILSGIPGAVAYLDDVLIGASSREEGLQRLEKVLQRLDEYGVKANEDKCKFLQTSIEYHLGHVISAEGLRPQESILEALREAPEPTGKDELRAYLGLINYYHSFIPDLSAKLLGFYELLRKEVPWNWSRECARVFQESKQWVLNSSLLVHYDVKKPIILTCDASPRGVGAVLSHLIDGQERPMAFASKTLSSSEKNYSQLHLESLALIFGVKKFHKFIYGRENVILQTDHQPLATIFGSKKGVPSLAAARLQRWALILSSYNLEVRYCKGTDIPHADALSRLPLPNTEPVELEANYISRVDQSMEVMNFFCSLSEVSTITSLDIARCTERDVVLAKVKDYVLHGWKEVNDPELAVYSRKKDDLSVDQNCLLWGARVIIPQKLRASVLQMLHEQHPGSTRMKMLARSYVWWPGLDQSIENCVATCNVCQFTRNAAPRLPLQQWPLVTQRWHRLHIDYAEDPNSRQQLLIIVDMFSKWLEVFIMTSTTSAKTIEKLRTLFSSFGRPREVVSDNGSCFTSIEYQEFMWKNGIKVTLSPPYHKESNGAAERYVQEVKKNLVRQVLEADNQNLSLQHKIDNYLFAYRNTPTTSTGVSHVSRVLDDKAELIPVDQRFEWPVARPVESHEQLQVQLFVHSRYLSDKLLGSYTLVLQKLVQDGRINVYDTLVDPNNKPLPATVELEVTYCPPDGVSTAGSSFSAQQIDLDQQMLIDIEQNIANLERSMNQGRRGSWQSGAGTSTRPHKQGLQRGGSLSAPEKYETSPATEKKSRRDNFKCSVKNLIRLGKQRPPKDTVSLLDHEQRPGQEREAPVPRPPSVSSLSSDNESTTSLHPDSPHISKRTKPAANISLLQSALKAQDFQVCITVIEARQLAGLNMDPVVCVQVGDTKKYTSVKESTNCPYYNEYFVFDFHMPAVMLFDKIITLSVLHSKKLLRSGTVVGTFKIDLRTVYDSADHQFYHKWALLTDPDDIAGGPKGYLKCDISVIGKGDTVKVPPKSEKDEDDIEANLLLPDGVPVERQRARFIVRVYRADGLPKMNSSIMANVKKAFTGEVKDLVDPYVQVSFAGLTGKTSVRKHSYAPVWNEQIVFTEMFPPLCQRIKVQLRDNDPVNNTVIGTHFLDLKTISNDGEKGFLPTFGPTFIHVYGSTRDYTLIDEHSNLNTGLGEGVSYRARLLVAIRTEITDNIDITPSQVDVEPTYPITETSYGKTEEFFLFSSILDASMIDKRLGDKPIFFELSIGNAGNTLDGHNETTQEPSDSDSDDNLEVVTSESISWQSTTSPIKPMTHDRTYYFLPYWDDKPCMHVRSLWPDYRRRMYNSNIINKLVDKLEEGLAEVHALVEGEEGAAERHLRNVLEELSSGCARYISVTRGAGSGPGIGKTKLDKERMKLCQRDIEHVGNMARNLKALVTKHSFRDRYKTAQTYLQKLKFLVEDPQHSLPDVFIWVISNGKRTAYQRIPARDLIYSIVDEECGKHCGKVFTMFLKLPGKKGLGPSGWAIQCKLQIYMWLGLIKHKKNFVNGLTKGYEISHEIRNAERPRAMPPSVIHYTSKFSFQLRAYMYQARSLIGSDASGLSDPFARVIVGEYCKTTQVIDETLSPTWDELLVFDEILIYGTREEIKNDPPTIIIEIFDQDKVGKSEFIGRALAKPHVKLLEEPYEKPEFPPSLEWYEISRGPEHAGELLATFELLQIASSSRDRAELPDLPPPKEFYHTAQPTADMDAGTLLPVPRGIRPTLAKYRIEVLFWGLRDLKRVHLMTVDKPRVDIECAGHILYSSVIQNAKKNPNFSTPVKFLELELPEQELYRPPLTIRCVDCRSFGRFTLVGTHMINSIHKYMFTPLTKREREAEERKRSLQQLQNEELNEMQPPPTSPFSNAMANGGVGIKENAPLLNKETIIVNYGTNQISAKDIKTETNRKRKQSVEEFDEDDENRDWWTKYFASIEAMIEESKEKRKEKQLQLTNGSLPIHVDSSPGQPSPVADNKVNKAKLGQSAAAKIVAKLSPKSVRRKVDKTAKMKIYPSELETQPVFNGFSEWLLTFELYRGKKTGDEQEDESRVVGTFKGAIKVYKWPLPKDVEDHTIMGLDPQYGFFQGLPSNDPIHVLVRVYVVKANELHPMDLNGKADPYVVLQLGSKRVSDKDNYISKQLNPVFGKCFEIEATFPQDSMLTVQILDWDLVGSDDLIGETKIDLENRFYSRHRATCGIASKYEDYGYNRWRDPMKPTQILAKLCKDGKMDSPMYSPGKIKVGRRTFCLQNTEDSPDWYNIKGAEEHMALAVLQHWHEFPRIGCTLVPEHIETRPLYNPEKPGIEQGKLEMWVDMFPMDMPLPGPPLDISPRKPKAYELRVIIWNTDEVVLEDDAFFTGEKMSDIYVKGWLKGPEDCQCTDIHYRSLTGEGNFNWRFVYPFEYLVAEEKIVISRKESLFSWDESESKIPARLELQVWDADHFSADDFLGAITLDLNRFPRGAKSSKLCTLGMLKTDGTVPMVNIFKQKRVKGWWPFYVKKENEEMELTGKVEAEIHLLTQEEAEKNPAGQGRNEPDPLDKPNRPDASFMWFLNPLKSIRYIVWHNYKWRILKMLIVMALFFMFFLFFYSVPGYTVKRMLGA